MNATEMKRGIIVVDRVFCDLHHLELALRSGAVFASVLTQSAIDLARRGMSPVKQDLQLHEQGCGGLPLLQLGGINALQGEAGGALSSSQARRGKRKQQCERDTQSGAERSEHP